MSISLPLARRTSTRLHLSYWTVACAFVALTAFSTVPSPLYPIYQRADGFSTLMITVVFAVYAVGVVVSLLLAGHLSDVHGRRRVLLPALALSLVSAALFLLSSSLPTLLAGRLVNGLAVGLVAATATAWLADLHAVRAPGASMRHPQLVAVAANLGGLGVGSLISGLLAEWAPDPLRLSYEVFVVVLALALVGVLVAVQPRAALPAGQRPAYRPQRVAVPSTSLARYAAACGAGLLAFAAIGVVTALTGTLLASSFGATSRALAGVSIFVTFLASALVQMALAAVDARGSLRLGCVAMGGGLLLVVVAVWLSAPSLPLFLVGCAVAGAGAGAMIKGAVGAVGELAAPEQRAEALAGFFLASYIGLALPAVGIGLLLQVASVPVTLTCFTALMIAGVAAAAPVLLRR